MGLIWKDNKNVEEIRTVIKGRPPKAFVDKVEKFCDYNNTETVGNKKKIDKHLTKPQSKFLIDFLEKNNLQQFDIKTLINKMDAWNFTDGTLQRKILALLTCKGIIRKEIIEYTNKKGETKYKILYSINKTQILCPFLNEKGNCEYEWKFARITKYFTERSKE